MELAGQTIAILGAGRSGLAAARLARKLGARPMVFDTGDAKKIANDLAKLRADNFEVILGIDGAKQAAAKETFDLVVTSPGIDAGWELPRLFTSRGVSLIGEIEFAWRQLRDTPVVAITGTNGKTTTTELIERMFNGCGRKTVACGNYGHPLCEVAGGGVRYEVLTVEISSFQLETVTSFAPRVGIWLNFAPDHLDRYPDMESYFAAKRRLFDHMTTNDVAVVREGEPLGDAQTPDRDLLHRRGFEGGLHTARPGHPLPQRERRPGRRPSRCRNATTSRTKWPRSPPAGRWAWSFRR